MTRSIIGDNRDIATGVSSTSMDEVVVTGYAETSDGWDLVAVALGTYGNLLSSFDGDGKAVYRYTDSGSGMSSEFNRGWDLTAVMTSARKPADGITDTIYIAAETTNPALVNATKDMAVLCINGDGTTCTGFGEGGWSLVDFSDNSLFGIGDTDDAPGSIYWDADKKKVMLIGQAVQTTGGLKSYLGLARFFPSTGMPDNAFGVSGHAYYTESESEDSFSGCQDHRNRTVAVGSIYSGSVTDHDVWVSRIITVDPGLFTNGFENGSTDAWDQVIP